MSFAFGSTALPKCGNGSGSVDYRLEDPVVCAGGRPEAARPFKTPASLNRQEYNSHPYRYVGPARSGSLGMWSFVRPRTLEVVRPGIRRQCDLLRGKSRSDDYIRRVHDKTLAIRHSR